MQNAASLLIEGNFSFHLEEYLRPSVTENTTLEEDISISNNSLVLSLSLKIREM